MKYICLLLMKPFYLIFNDIINKYSLKTDHFWNYTEFGLYWLRFTNELDWILQKYEWNATYLCIL